MTLDGKQLSLGVDDPRNQQAALAAMQKLLDSMKPTAPPVTVTEAAERYFAAAVARGVGPATLAYYHRHAGNLVAAFGDRMVASITPAMVEELVRTKTWTASTKRGFLQTAEAMLRAAGAVMVDDRGERRPWTAKKPAKGRMLEPVPESVYWQLRGSARGDFRPYLDVLWHTGARPGEVAGLTVELIDWPGTMAVLTEHKTDADGRPRVIHFNDAAMAALRKQKELHGSGPLFRNEKGRQWNAHRAGRRIWALAERLGIKACLYGFRHGFATRALAAGVPDAHVAELLGHHGTETLHRHYNHLGQMHGALKASLNKLG